jgi:iron complex outermembrane receptor protein
MNKISFNGLRLCLTAMVVFFSFLPSFVQAREGEYPDKGLITGQVTTADNKVAEGVTVRLKGTTKVSMTTETGFYSFKNLPAGTYEIEVSLVGHTPLSKTVTIDTDGKKNNVSFKLDVSQVELEEVVVTSGANRYKISGVSPSLRLQTSLLETPQNIQVVGAQLLADQQVYDIVDGITRNVSGATRVGHWDNQYAQIRMRGSKIPAFRNGMNIEASWGPTAEDAAMIERIEFVKGPAGFMLAAGEPGGFYNVVTKKPTGITKGSANISMGSFSTYRAAIDFDGKLSKDGKLLYRFNFAATQKDFYTKYNYSNRYVIAPVLKYQIDDKTSITAEYTYQWSKYLGNGNYQFSAKSLNDPGIGNDFFYGDPSAEPGKLKDHSVYLYLDHQLNDKWQAHAQVAYFNFGMEASSQWIDSIAANGDARRYYNIGDEAGENRFAQFSLAGEEYTGSVRHRILAGVDMGNKKFWGDFRSGNPDIRLAKTATNPNGMFNIYNPLYGIPFANIPVFDRSQNVRTRAGASSYLGSVNYTSVYAQDELGFFKNDLRLSLGLRFTHAETVGQSIAASISDNVFSPRVGLSYSIDKTTSVYALYDQSFVPTPGLDSNLQAFKPVKGNDIEAGIKKNWFNGRWTSSVSAYRIVRQNAKVSLGIKDSRGADVSEQLGETISKGIEVDINGEIVRGLNLNVNYAYTDSKVSKDAPNKPAASSTVGNITPNTAAHVTNAWLNYRLSKGALEGFGISGGIQWQAERAVGTTRVYNVPNYFRADGGLNYTKGRYNISLLVNNLLDNRKLLTAASIPANPGSKSLYSYIVEARRNFRMTVAYRF